MTFTRVFEESLLFLSTVLGQGPAEKVPVQLGTSFFGLVDVADDILTKGTRVVVILVAMLIATRILLMLVDKFKRVFVPAADVLGVADAKRIETLASILRNALYAVVIFFTFSFLLSEFGVNIAPLVAGAGVAGVAFGFGAQSLVKDLVQGFFILLENQFGIGDTIKVGDVTGQVERMTLRTVTLRDADGRLIILPNSEAAKVIIYSHGWSAMNLDLEVALETNIDGAFKVIEQVNERIYKQYKKDFSEKPKILGVESMTSKGIVIKVTAKTKPQKQWEAAREYRKAIKEAFDEAGIKLPTPVA